MPNKRNFSRRANKPNRVARQSDVTAKRVFRATSRIFLQTDNPSQGGVQGFFGVAIDVSDFPGSAFVSKNYEQFQLKRAKVMMKPSPATLEAPSSVGDAIEYQNRVYSLMNGTEVESYIDYDSSVNPGNYNELLTRPNLKVRALQPNNWTMVANFVPKSLSNPSFTANAPSITWGPNVWLSTENMDVPFRGLLGRVSNRAPVFGTQDDVACVDVMISIDVHMRGPKNGLGTTSVHADLDLGNPQILPSRQGDENGDDVVRE